MNISTNSYSDYNNWFGVYKHEIKFKYSTELSKYTHSDDDLHLRLYD